MVLRRAVKQPRSLEDVFLGTEPNSKICRLQTVSLRQKQSKTPTECHQELTVKKDLYLSQKLGMSRRIKKRLQGQLKSSSKFFSFLAGYPIFVPIGLLIG